MVLPWYYQNYYHGITKIITNKTTEKVLELGDEEPSRAYPHDSGGFKRGCADPVVIESKTEAIRNKKNKKNCGRGKNEDGETRSFRGMCRRPEGGLCPMFLLHLHKRNDKRQKKYQLRKDVT
ncbi:hypothetical protein ADUPG1_010629 [Aduncisulcus paluster]|uniref:Uncharacterized protein n=1 Tax=Aduncisulcus paluster TaxID=2918883 RepID=A0ABQ5JUG6_9EUKA|nr:hypothetical protein ADUPG1_010629 [Aduncisulcus paluster]